MFTILPADTKINFMGARKAAGIVSAVLLAAAIGTALLVGPKYGIDFAGGIELQVRLHNDTSIDTLRETADGSGLGSFEIQSYGEDGNQFLLRVKQPEGTELKEIVRSIQGALKAQYTAEGFEVERQEFVGPKAGAELREKGYYAMLFSLIGILLYISIRFEFGFALGAVSALFHDVLLVVGFFILIGHEFNLQTLAALLTIVGYSLNDTIIVFDRIRENIGRKSKNNLESTMNASINEMLSRTILTSITTLFTVTALYLLSASGSVIKDFALALLTGIIVGTYSSVYVASPVVLLYENFRKKAK